MQSTSISRLLITRGGKVNAAIDTLLIDADLDARLRFKQAIQMLGVRVSVSTTTTLFEALQRLDTLRSCDIVYVSSRFDSEVLSGFVTSARRTKQGKNAAFMMMVPAPDCQTTTLARFALAGADGFLLEPYSAAGLEGTIRSGLLARHKRAVSSRRLAIELLVKSVIDAMREYRKRAAAGLPTRGNRTGIEKTLQIVRDLDAQGRDEYMDLLMERMLTSNPATSNNAPQQRGSNLPRKVVRRVF